MCGPACHMGKPWAEVPCLNSEAGARVRSLKPAEVRRALCDAGLSPVGDKNELLKVRRCRKLTVMIIFPC